MRVLERLDRLYAIGGGPGANRLGGTREEDEAHELVAGWMREAGLEVEVDAAGNLFGRLRGRRPELPEVWTGSHLDSVPNGGRFDGALGVVGGLEAVERLGQRERTLVVIAFRDEEGCTGPGCRGSRSLCSGRLDPVPAAFVELHIEQGPRLEAAGAPLGVVTGIAATARGKVVFEGREGHAGTTPMPQRDDALVAAAELVLRLRDAAAERRRRGRNGRPALGRAGRVERDPCAGRAERGRAGTGRRAARAGGCGRARPSSRARRAVAMSPTPRAALLEQLGGSRSGPRSSSLRARATTPACWRRRACRRRCSSSAA